MKTIEDGHVYDLEQREKHLTGETQTLTFVNREPGHEHTGTTTQEAIRALIDRTQYCDNCLPWSGNKEAVKYLRMALILHECRALLIKTEKGELLPEYVPVGNDGHFMLTQVIPTEAEVPYAFHNREPDTTETGSLNAGVPCHTPVDAE